MKRFIHFKTGKKLLTYVLTVSYLREGVGEERKILKEKKNYFAYYIDCLKYKNQLYSRRVVKVSKT